MLNVTHQSLDARSCNAFVHSHATIYARSADVSFASLTLAPHAEMIATTLRWENNLTIGAFHHYFYYDTSENSTVPTRQTNEDTLSAESKNVVTDDTSHHHYHKDAYKYHPGAVIDNDLPHAPKLRPRRRRHDRVCVPHSFIIGDPGARREEFYEQKLLENLPWYATQRATIDENKKQLSQN